jgi:diguanylate cyclase (GGDEF)-like protein
MLILIVDDSDSSRLLLETILRNAGYTQVVTAGSAAEALDVLGVNGGGQSLDVDCVLMDIVMPGMDGIEAVRAIKATPRLRDIPVLMVTVRDEEESLERAFEAGAIDYIQKPVSKIELRARVNSALRLKAEMDARKARERELEELTGKLAQLSNMDGLTGAPNRRNFEAFFRSEWKRASRSGLPLSVLMIDIDFFKNYNDHYGHLDGDECLRRVAAAINGALRRPSDFYARYGGEEFVAVLPGTDTDGAATIAERIRRRVKELSIPHEASAIATHVTVSAGAATACDFEHTDAFDLVEAADRALYQAKNAGRDQVGLAILGC